MAEEALDSRDTAMDQFLALAQSGSEHCRKRIDLFITMGEKHGVDDFGAPEVLVTPKHIEELIGRNWTDFITVLCAKCTPPVHTVPSLLVSAAQSSPSSIVFLLGEHHYSSDALERCFRALVSVMSTERCTNFTRCAVHAVVRTAFDSGYTFPKTMWDPCLCDESGVRGHDAVLTTVNRLAMCAFFDVSALTPAEEASMRTTLSHVTDEKERRSALTRRLYLAMMHDTILSVQGMFPVQRYILKRLLPVPVTKAAMILFNNVTTMHKHERNTHVVQCALLQWWSPANHSAQDKITRNVALAVFLCAHRLSGRDGDKHGLPVLPLELWVMITCKVSLPYYRRTHTMG